MRWDAVMTMAGAAALCLFACDSGSHHPTTPDEVDKEDNVDDPGNQPRLIAVAPSQIVGFSNDAPEKGKTTAPRTVTLAENLRAQLLAGGKRHLLALAPSKNNLEIRVFASPTALAKAPTRTIPTRIDSTHHTAIGFAYSTRRDAALILARAEDGTYALHVQPLESPKPSKAMTGNDGGPPSTRTTDAQVEAINVPEARKLVHASYDDRRDVLYAIAKAPFQPDFLPRQDEKHALLRISNATAESRHVQTLPLPEPVNRREVGACALDEEGDRLLLMVDGQLAAVEHVSGDSPAVVTFERSLGEQVGMVREADVAIQYGKRFPGTSMVVDAAARRVWISAMGVIAGFSLDDEASLPLLLKPPGLVSSLVLFDAGSINQ